MPNSKGFTRIPHDILNGIIESRLNTRQMKIVLLILRLESGCHTEWAQLKQSDFKSARIEPSHIDEVKKPLLAMGIILQNGEKQEYKINEEYFVKDYDNPSRLVKLVGKHLSRKHSQKRKHTIPKQGTSYVPKWELSSSHNRKLYSHGLASMKDMFIDNIKYNDKEIPDGMADRPYEEIIQNPANKIESNAVELHNILEPNNVKSLSYYLKIARHSSIGYLYPIASDIKQDSSISRQSKGKEFMLKTYHLIPSSISG